MSSDGRVEGRFGAYFKVLLSSEWSTIIFAYDFPLAIIGFALKVCRAEASRMPKDAFSLQESQVRDILKQDGGISLCYAPRLQFICEEYVLLSHLLKDGPLEPCHHQHQGWKMRKV
ncbi:hypothetical protein CY35_04G126900 [Sphagnum magellanicum]|nr:hypothetical protein CY35_04G126900 [Sphagnum magellanicum]